MNTAANRNDLFHALLYLLRKIYFNLELAIDSIKLLENSLSRRSPKMLGNIEWLLMTLREWSLPLNTYCQNLAEMILFVLSSSLEKPAKSYITFQSFFTRKGYTNNDTYGCSHLETWYVMTLFLPSNTLERFWQYCIVYDTAWIQ